jgi:Tat protein secretion system quality control protein TatD with DNase activity
VRKFLFAAGYLQDALESFELSLKSEDFYCTVGVHPCRAKEPLIDFSKDHQVEETDVLTAEMVDLYLKKIDKLLTEKRST